MNLDELKLSRRNFLKIVGTLAVSVYVPQLSPMPGWRISLVPPWHIDQELDWRIITPHYMMVPHGSFLSASMVLPETASGIAELSLLWTSDTNTEMGWWADYLELHIGHLGETISPIACIPETIKPLQTDGPGILNRTTLGSFPASPGAVLVAGLTNSEATVYGLDLAYQERDFT